MADPIAAAVSFLKGDATVLMLTQGRVYGAELPQAEAAYMPRSVVVVRPAGGPGNNNYSPVYEQRVDVLCYGQSAAKAMELSSACQNALQFMQRQTQAGCVLYRASQSSGHSYFRDPGVPTWPIFQMTWLIATTLLPSEV